MWQVKRGKKQQLTGSSPLPTKATATTYKHRRLILKYDLPSRLINGLNDGRHSRRFAFVEYFQ